MPAPENTTQNKPELPPGSKIVSPSAPAQEPPFTPTEVVESTKTVDVDKVLPSNTPAATPEPTPKAGEDKGQEQKTDKVEDKSSPSFEDFLKEMTGVDKLPDKKPAEKKVESAAPQIKPQYPEERDYSGLPDDYVPLFKNMSNAAFASLKPQIVEYLTLKKENEELKRAKPNGELPQSYYEHPQGFALSPDYQASFRDLTLCRQIYDHWFEQLQNVKQGKDWEDLNYDEKSGKYFKSEPKAAEPRAEAFLISTLSFAQDQMSKMQERTENLARTFQARHKEDVDQIKQYEKQYFSAYEDEKHPMRPTIQKVIEKLPPAYRNSPISKLFAYVVANNVQLRYMMDDMQSKLQGKAAVAQDKVKAGPNMNDINNVAPAKSSPSAPSFEDFRREMNS